MEKKYNPKDLEFDKSKFKTIEEAVSQYKKYIDYHNGYFSNHQAMVWKNNYSNLFDGIKHQIELVVRGLIVLNNDEVELIKTFNDYYNNFDIYRKNFNKQFIENELNHYDIFFNNIEGRKLDTQQRKAIITNEDNNLIIAGAGSGKTTTIVGKVNYIMERYKTKPDSILLISFTNKSASTLSNRIDIKNITAKTFHKFGKDVIAEVEGEQPNIFDDDQFKPYLQKTFSELIKDTNYLEKVTRYFTDFMKPIKSQFDFKTHGEYIQYLKDKNFRTYKLVENKTKTKTTFQMEVVKSIEECKIANFLLFNNIDYKYEDAYEHSTKNPKYKQYKPDFKITQNKKTIYLEHFAVSKNGDVPPFFTKDGETYQEAKKRYWEKIQWARNIHKYYKTKMIETYSYEMFDKTLYENLTKRLKAEDIILKPKPPEEIWHIIQETAQEEISDLIALFQTFITLLKSNNYSISDITKKNEQIQDTYLKERNLLFIEIIRPIYENYQNHLAEREEIDFSDMINKASEYITNKIYKKDFEYIIIDEFQDISIGRYQLIKALKNANPSCKLFCVGDDWQSIYRFSGSDIALFKYFEEYFGITAKSKIETTYRFHNPLLELSSNFIQQNPNQSNKELKGISNSKSTEYKIYSESANYDDTTIIKEILDELISTDENIEKKSFFILGRYNHDIQRIKNENEIFSIKKGDIPKITYQTTSIDGEKKNINLQFLTVHKAKGLEADIVIITNCNSGRYGFPSEIADDPVLNLLLSEADQFNNSEERRLFYVAMTRAREKVYFIADKTYKSKFINELETKTTETKVKQCPYCKTGNITQRSGITNGKKWAFNGCSNYRYGCNYQERITSTNQSSWKEWSLN